MDNAKGKNCPFCGSEDLGFASEGFSTSVWCRDCDAQGPTIRDYNSSPDEISDILKIHATTAWNQRVGR